MDVDGQGGQEEPTRVDSLSGIESKKHRMATGQESEDFARRYKLLEQVGSGASGTVWKCRLADGLPGGGIGNGDDPVPGVVYAAKIIDLRPFKLRERFSMQRLMREVEIMRRLRHPNIIGLVEALDTPEQLVLVLEYAPGVELFDAILGKTSFSEDEARPVFVQVARALQYMHSKQIVHRDIKPENVMIMDRPAPDGLYPEAKLLDFGLSKAIDPDWGGSVARTFVGTPSYLAPEVEDKHGGKGKPYGTAVDCWSLGAMLYVMLVARFPEFQVQGTRKYVRMVGAAWDKVSSEAKELIRQLMAFDAGSRLTVAQALRHPWLKDLAEKPEPPPTQLPPARMQDMMPIVENAAFTIPEAEPASSTSAKPGAGAGKDFSRRKPYYQDGSRGQPPVITEQQTPPSATEKNPFKFGGRTGPQIRELNSDESPFSSLDSGMGDPITADQDYGHEDANHGHHASEGMDECCQDHETAMVKAYRADLGLVGRYGGTVPLLQLQKRITACMETSMTTYSENPEGGASLRRSATLCRENLRESVTLLRRIERTAAQVITLFPDLMLAVEEGVPELAHDFFSTVKTWVREMYAAVSLVQARNNANAEKVSEAMKIHAEGGLYRGQKQRGPGDEASRAEAATESAAFTAESQRSGGSGGLSGDIEADAGRQDKTITVDPETFELIQKIQAMKKRAKDPALRPSGFVGDDAQVEGPNNPIDFVSDEKLINLFLLMGKSGVVGERGRGGSSSSVGEETPSQASAERNWSLEGHASGSFNSGVEQAASTFAEAALFKPTSGGASGTGSGSDLGVLDAAGKRKASGARDSSADAPPAAVGASGVADTTRVVGGHDGALAYGLAAQMSIDGGAGGLGQTTANVNTVENTSGDEDGAEGEEDAGRWEGMQLARLRNDDDKVFLEVQQALKVLHEVDSVLEQLALFWANSEVIFDVLLRKGDLVEKFVAFSNKPRLFQRFKERLADYKMFWEGVQVVCNRYVSGQVVNGGGCMGAGVNFPGTEANVPRKSGGLTRGNSTYENRHEHDHVDREASTEDFPRDTSNRSSTGSGGGRGIRGGGGSSTADMGMRAQNFRR